MARLCLALLRNRIYTTMGLIGQNSTLIRFKLGKAESRWGNYKKVGSSGKPPEIPTLFFDYAVAYSTII